MPVFVDNFLTPGELVWLTRQRILTSVEALGLVPSFLPSYRYRWTLQKALKRLERRKAKKEERTRRAGREARRRQRAQRDGKATGDGKRLRSDGKETRDGKHLRRTGKATGEKKQLRRAGKATGEKKQLRRTGKTTTDRKQLRRDGTSARKQVGQGRRAKGKRWHGALARLEARKRTHARRIEAIKLALSGKRFTVSRYADAYIRRLLRVAAREGIPVYVGPSVVYEPVHRTEHEKDFFQRGVDYFQSLATEFPTTSVLYRRVFLARTGEMGNNHVHLNARGRRRYTTYLARRLLKAGIGKTQGAPRERGQMKKQKRPGTAPGS